MAGSGSMTPISPGIPTGLSTAVPLPITLLSLSKYAKIMGIVPAHFWQGAAPNIDPQVFPLSGSCDSLWHQYAWQDSDKVGRYDIAQAIYDAERDLANALGYWPAPMWIANEEHVYPRPYRREYVGLGTDLRGSVKGITAGYGKIVRDGRRAVLPIATASTGGSGLAYSDEDGDGFYETASVTVVTTETDVCALKVYFSDKDGEPDWEIREPKSKVISSGSVVFIFDSWLFIDPDLFELPPTDMGPDALDLSTTVNFVGSVDVYKEYVNNAIAAVEFLWEPDGIPCDPVLDSCDDLSASGCVRIRDAEVGILAPSPANYSADTDKWTGTTWAGSREPDRVRFWYQAGERAREFMRGISCDPLDLQWAQTIAWLATARLERPLCACNQAAALSQRLQTDLTERGETNQFFTTLEIAGNPFGTRIGEVSAWRKVARLAAKRTVPALA